MSFIKWDESFSVGVEIIDIQHQKLFSLINKLHDIVERVGREKSEPLENIILELAAYVDFHFGTEEKYFKEFNYENAAIHNQQHKFYEDKIRDFSDKYQRGEGEIGEKILIFLKDWISGHIKVVDKEYTKCFNDHGLV